MDGIHGRGHAHPPAVALGHHQGQTVDGGHHQTAKHRPMRIHVLREHLVHMAAHGRGGHRLWLQGLVLIAHALNAPVRLA